MKYNAIFTSVWDGGLKINSKCCANRKTKIISRIGENDVNDSVEEGLDCLEDEYITFLDTNEKFRAVLIEEMDEYEKHGEIVFGY